MTKVSIITPTGGRRRFLELCLGYVKAQTLPGIEWLILDDGEEPSKLAAFDDSSIVYSHSRTKLTVGEKRNRLIERASGEVIIHFDDDDYYHPAYVETVLAELERSRYDLMNLRGWFLYDRRVRFFGYWDLMQVGGAHFKVGASGVKSTVLNADGFKNNELGWGFGFAYRKAVWTAHPFEDISWNEDGRFALAAQERFRLGGLHDRHGLCLHIVHGTNSSTTYPQFALPLFMLEQIFPGASVDPA